VTRQGVAFDYSSPAELYLSRRRGRHTCRRFATAAEAILYAVEELRTRRYRVSVWMLVGDERLNKREIYRLYFPLSESLSAIPIRQHETDVSTRLSVRIDLASGGHLESGKISLLEAIQAQKTISGAARSLGMSYLGAWRCVQAINNALSAPAVATDVGGRNYGGAVLTPIGIQIVDLYRAMEASAQLAADAELRAIEALARDGGGD
jgi:molybdate transport system regulatory protein